MISLHDWDREISKAEERIGNSPVNVMAWLLRFARLNLNNLSAGDQTNLQYELTRLRDFGFSPGVTNGRHAVHKGAEGLVTVEETATVQQWLKDSLTGIVNQDDVAFQFSNITRELLHFGSGKWVEVVRAETPAASIRYAVFDLLKLHADRIRQCPSADCEQKIFLSDRTNKRFCSTRCQTREATRSYREAHGLNTGRKRGRPPKVKLKSKGARHGKSRRKR